MPCVGCRVAQPSIAGGDHDLLLRRRSAMEHKPRVDLQAIADLSPVESRAPMSRDERLARWVEVLERDPKRILRPLHGIEFRKPEERRAIRADNSPLTVAYEDPVLRSEGRSLLSRRRLRLCRKFPGQQHLHPEDRRHAGHQHREEPETAWASSFFACVAEVVAQIEGGGPE